MSLFKKKEKEKTATEWFQLGLDAEDLEKQVEYYTKALEVDPEYAGVWGVKGNALRNLGMYDEAIACLNKALEIDPENTHAWIFKGYALRDFGKYDEANTCFDKALELDPENGGVWENKGNALRNNGKYDEAIVCFDKSLQINPNDAITWHNKGNTLYELCRYDEAITCFDEALEIDSENAEVWKNKGIALGLQLKRSDEAIACFDKALSTDPENTYAWIFKGNALFDLERYGEANKCCNKALKIDPENDDALKLKERSGRELKKENVNEKNLEENPAENYLTKVNLELFEEAMNILEGDPIKAINVFEKRINEYPNESILWYFMGKAYAKIGDDIKSLKYYDKAIELAPQNFLAWKEKGLLLSNKNPHEAIKCFDKSIELYGDAQFWFYKGLVLASYLGEHEDAIHCLSKALETEYEFIQDWHYAAWYQRGVSLYELDEYEEAIVCFDKAIEIDSNMEDAWTGKGKSLLKLGKIDESDECLYFINKIRESKPESHGEGGTNEETIRKQISALDSEINHLTKDRTKKFSEAGDVAYSECMETAPELTSYAQTELDNILAIDTLISTTNQEMEKAKGEKKKTGFLNKLGDTVSSVAKQGKLKVELYNLERKKNSAITDFGDALWESHKSGDDTLQKLSDIWQAIEDIEQQIHENEEEIDRLNGPLR